MLIRIKSNGCPIEFLIKVGISAIIRFATHEQCNGKSDATFSKALLFCFVFSTSVPSLSVIIRCDCCCVKLLVLDLQADNHQRIHYEQIYIHLILRALLATYLRFAWVFASLGAIFSITILSRKLQIDDSLLCLISVSSKFVGSIWTAFVKTDIEMYLIPLAEILNGTTITSLRSIISKLVDRQEIAKVNSLFSLTETLASLVFQPFYSWLYMRTLHVLPGAVFLTSATLIVPASFILGLFYVQNRIELRNARKKALEAEEKKENEAKKLEKVEFPEPPIDSTNL